MQKFPLIDDYLGLTLDMDVAGLKPGSYAVTETPRRLKCEPSYGFVHAFYGIFFIDGRVAISVTPGARAEVMDLLRSSQPAAERVIEPAWFDRLSTAVRQARRQAGLTPERSAYESLMFACNAGVLQRHHHGDCRPLHDDRIPPAEGLYLPTHCFPDGIVYGIVEDEQVVSIAYAHKSRKMEDRVVDLGVETAPAYRNRGYAKTVVSAVTAQMTAIGGEAVYNCSPTNQASIATAQSVGYQLYGRLVIVSAPAPEAV